jgi:hypothetical protein
MLGNLALSVKGTGLMEAGIADHVWSLAEIVSLLD